MGHQGEGRAREREREMWRVAEIKDERATWRASGTDENHTSENERAVQADADELSSSHLGDGERAGKLLGVGAHALHPGVHVRHVGALDCRKWNPQVKKGVTSSVCRVHVCDSSCGGGNERSERSVA
jgi:hypothetical protein